MVLAGRRASQPALPIRPPLDRESLHSVVPRCRLAHAPREPGGVKNDCLLGAQHGPSGIARSLGYALVLRRAAQVVADRRGALPAHQNTRWSRTPTRWTAPMRHQKPRTSRATRAAQKGISLNGLSTRGEDRWRRYALASLAGSGRRRSYTCLSDLALCAFAIAPAIPWLGADGATPALARSDRGVRTSRRASANSPPLATAVPDVKQRGLNSPRVTGATNV
jgi:hypothetical protein